MADENSYTEKILNALSDNWRDLYKIIRKMGIKDFNLYNSIEESLHDLSRRGLIFEHEFKNLKHWSLSPNISNKMIKKVIQYREISNTSNKLINRFLQNKEIDTQYKGRRNLREDDDKINTRDSKVISELEGIPHLNLSYEIKEGNVSGLLILDNDNMSKIPEVIKELQDLEYLATICIGDLTFPEWIGNLKNLQIIKLGSNKITEIPPCITNLKKLRVLDIGDNPLATVPEIIKDIPSLEDLGLCRLKIKALPEWLGDLKQLKKIDISG